MADRYEIGVAKVDMTPPFCVPFLGYAPRRHDFFTGVHDRLFARLAFLSDGRTEALLLTADTIGFADSLLGPERSFIQELRQRLGDAAEVPPERVMAAAAHVHSAPEMLNFRPFVEHPGVAEWVDHLMDDLAAGAARAREDAFSATLKVGSGRCPGISRNRRGETSLDDELIVLLFAGGGRRVVMANFACHPVIVQVQPLVSADFVGVLQTSVEERVDACMFLQGACGDINPVAARIEDFPDRFEGVRWTGEALAEAVLTVVDRLATEDASSGPPVVRAASRMLDLPSRELPTGDELEVIRARAAEGGAMESETMARVEEGDAPFRAELQALRIGQAVLVGIPGEPFCSLGLAIKCAAQPLVGVPIGYANGYLGYLAPPEAWEKGGYEVSCGPWSKVGPEAFSRLLQAANDLLAELS